MVKVSVASRWTVSTSGKEWSAARQLVCFTGINNQCAHGKMLVQATGLVLAL